MAIDTPALDRAEAIARAVAALAGGLKLGLEFFVANGPAGVRALAAYGLPLFIDLKLHDIPNTVGHAVAALTPLSPAVLTVHAAGGDAMMRAARAAAPPTTKIVAVTVLTSLDRDDLAASGVASPPAEQVGRLAQNARAAGLDGIVCSGEEVEQAKREWPDGYFVVPGVRPVENTVGDQKRVVTPRQALERGASMLVVGRPITAKPDMTAAIQALAAAL